MSATIVLAQTPRERVRLYLEDIEQMSRLALEVAESAEAAASVDDVKAHADEVFALVWGTPSGLADGGSGATNQHGWKVRWQVTGGEFDPDFTKRYGDEPPTITDPRALGIAGRALAVRRMLVGNHVEEPSVEMDGARLEPFVSSLNNVVGWMKVSTGNKGAEIQPRISLTEQWTAPSAFWNTDADTGRLHAVYAQAINILKTDYQGDVAEARRHAAGLSQLLRDVVDGVDHDGDGRVAAGMMEGGLAAAFAEARAAGLLD